MTSSEQHTSQLAHVTNLTVLAEPDRCRSSVHQSKSATRRRDAEGERDHGTVATGLDPVQPQAQIAWPRGIEAMLLPPYVLTRSDE